MKINGEKAKSVGSIAIFIAAGFLLGYLSHENIAHANHQIVSLEKPDYNDTYLLSNKYNRKIDDKMWDVYLDPYFNPDAVKIKLLPLVSLAPVSSEQGRIQTADCEKELRIIAQVPNLSPEDIKIEACENSITIEAQIKREAKNAGSFESLEESFRQSLNLPCRVDAERIKANVKEGVLTVVLPKYGVEP